MASNQPVNFNRLYDIMREGELNQTSDTWIGLFDRLADRIILDLHPSSVLDAGCGRGYLVSSLRKRGVEAWGLDNSESSIQNALPGSLPFCLMGSILDRLPREHYDLIVCIDILEHYSPLEAIKAVENLCQHTDDILLSCTPIEKPDSASINVQPPEYWTRLLDRFGFIHDLELDASFVAPWAMRFIRAQPALEDRVTTYEKKFWQLSQEVALRRDLSLEYKNELASKEMELRYWRDASKQLQSALDAIRNSASWKFTTRLQHFRERTIPIGSRREKYMRSILRGYGILRREGIFRGSVFAIRRFIESIKFLVKMLWLKFQRRYSLSPGINQVCNIDSVVDRPPVEHIHPAADIIICVHNALDDVKRCLSSLQETTNQPHHLILVDDGSNEQTAQYLREFAHAYQATLLRSDEATGYTYAANRGMRVSSAEFLLLLNSDTILTPDWLDRCMACIQSDEKNGMVGPLSNTASWQSVPKIEDNGDWASNLLPNGISPARMAQLIAAHSARLYPEMPLLNGFCLMIRRKLLDEVGLFDEENFGQGYGEEDDLVLRARKLGWKMALADDVYIYHAQSKSYSSDKRHALSERAGKILREKHGESIISQSVRFCQQDLVLEGIRARAQVAIDRDNYLNSGRQFAGKKILIILPVNTPGGGANVIRSESIALNKMGVSVTFFNLEANREGFVKSYPDFPFPTIFGKIEDLITIASNFDAVVATFNLSVSWVEPLQTKDNHPILGYYVQGFEPLMYPEGTPGYKIALDSYSLIDGMTLFTKTEWTRQQVKTYAGRECKVINASVDIDLYRPRPQTNPRLPNSSLRVGAMIRPESHYREPDKTMRLLNETYRKYKGEVDILLFGARSDDPNFLTLRHNFPWKSYGILSTGQVANLLNQVDIFIDYSSHQAMGLTAMEAMACGCAVVVPQKGGVTSYAQHEKNSLVIDTSDYENMWSAMQRLIEDEKMRNKLQYNAIKDICAFFPEQSALNILRALFAQ